MFRRSRPGRRRTRRAPSVRTSFLGGRKPRFELLEDRRLLAIITVNSAMDGAPVADGNLTLREAITAANTNAPSGDAPAGTAGLDDIRFAIPGAGPHTITISAGVLPNIVEQLTIDGYTQAGSSANTAAITASINADLRIIIDGGGGAFDGFRIAAGGAGTTIRGLVINNFGGDGIEINAANNVIAGNFIGTDVTGEVDVGNSGSGVVISGGTNNRIGGTAAADRNLISGNNTDGVRLESNSTSTTTVLGNFIGTDKDGIQDLGNSDDGVELDGSDNNTIGGTTTASRNVIAGNNGDGISLTDDADGNTIQGNYIGLGRDGSTALGNNDGIFIASGSSGNTIGGTTAGARNVISSNSDDGIDIRGDNTDGNTVQGNFIGTASNGTTDRGNNGEGVEISNGAENNVIGGTAAGAGNLIAFNSDGVTVENAGTTGNRIQRNSIRNNDDLGIDLNDNGVTANDAGDGDNGPNRLQNFPVFFGNATLLGDSIALRYLVDSAVGANAAYPLTIEFFVADSDNQEGRTFLAADNYVAGNAQNEKMITIPAPAVLTNTFLVATATDADGNTSEFSAPVQIAPPRILGSEPTVILPNETISDNEIDFYQYIAHSTGKLVVRIDFLHLFGDLDLEVRDEFGNLLEMSNTSDPDQNFEQVIIPVVTQERYFISVIAVDFDDQTNFYSLEVENFPAPAPTGVHLDPASDTGMMNNDNVTSDTTPTFFIQTDVLNFVDTNNNGSYQEPDTFPAATEDKIDALTAAEANAIAAGTPDANDESGGISVEITLVNTTDGTTIVTGFADAVIGTFPDVYRFTVPAATPLTPGVYLVTARTKVWDGQKDENGDPQQAMGRSGASPPLWITIDTTAPNGTASIDLLPSSDSGMFNDDMVTNKMAPAFFGTGQPNSKVRIFAFDVLEGSLQIVGQGVVGSDGRWEVTVEPMDDGKYNFTAEFESAAGVFSPRVGVDSQSFTQTTDLPIPDNNTMVTSTLDLSGAGLDAIQDMTVTINVEHTFVGDLDIFLISPDGTRVALTTDNGGSGDDFVDTTFDDAAARSITGVGTLDAPFTGRFRPEDPLSNFFGENPNGVWTLEITDDAQPDVGTLLEWTLTFITPKMVVIDTVAPNTPFLDLLDDTGRHNNDNITKDNTPRFSMTSSDPNIALAQLLYADNLKFRIYDRYQGSATEVLIYDSALDPVADAITSVVGFEAMFTAATQLTRTLPVLLPASPAIVGGALADGVHNLKLEVEDRAGNISHDFLLTITVDTTFPPVSFGLPAAASTIDGLTASSDTGVTTVPATFADRITSDTTPTMWGRAEADTVVRLFLDRNNNGIVDLLTDTFLGQTVALPFDGNDAYPDGYWEITSVLDLNEIVGLPKDGLRRLLVTAEDVAGNPMPMNNQINQGVDSLQIFIDTQGPQVFDPDGAGANQAVQITNFPTFDLFDPKPSTNGYTPLVSSLTINIRDLPARDAAFLYRALSDDNAATPSIADGIAQTLGNYLLVGDHVGTIAIQSVVATLNAPVAGQQATGTVRLDFFAPLPDDRFTLTIRDNLVDPAGNKLDGESNASEPQEEPTFPSGDGVPGGNFVARFTVDSRPEIGAFVSQAIQLDLNGNFVWDPANGQIGNDTTNRDIAFTLPAFEGGSAIPGDQSPHELLVAGRFTPVGTNMAGARFFDQLATYGNYNGVFRWLIDLDSDGVVYGDGDPDGTNDIIVNQGVLAGFSSTARAAAIPVAGDFDRNPNNGDEIGLYYAGIWALDTNHDYILDRVVTSNLNGTPIVGDFDGNGFDDLAVFNSNQFFFDLSFNPLADTTASSQAVIVWGFPGVLDRPVAADMDQDGIDDIGLWVPRNSANPPRIIAEWHFLVSNDPTGNLRVPGTVNRLNHPFSPVPFGADLFAEFGDEMAMPIVGNFDPPVAAAAPTQQTALAGDFNDDGRVDQADYGVWKSSFGSNSNLAADGNGNGVVDAGDYTVWRNNLGATSGSGAGSGGSGGGGSVTAAVLASAATTANEPVAQRSEIATVAAIAAETIAAPAVVLAAVSAPVTSPVVALDSAPSTALSSGPASTSAVLAALTATSTGSTRTSPVFATAVSTAPADEQSLLVLADLASAGLDEALERLASDASERVVGDEASTDVDDSAVAVAWQSWDEL